MRILDLFCGAGGASMGYHQAFPDADIVGVDIAPQPDYPFTFIQGDALNPPVDLDAFDFIHASPPCQAHSVNTPTWAKDNHVDLIPATRELLRSYTFVIENVPLAPLRPDLMLCGSMFGLQVQRHRIFEVSLHLFFWNPPRCNHNFWVNDSPHTVTGHADGDSWDRRSKYLGFRDTEHARELMGMPWVTKTRGITEAIPPAYTEWIGNQLTGLL